MKVARPANAHDLARAGRRERRRSSTRPGCRTRSSRCAFTRSRMPRTPSRTMIVRGAPLIGATAAYGMALAMAHDPSDASLAARAALLLATRPTAVNLRWALDDMRARLAPLPPATRATAAVARAAAIADEDVAINRAIAAHGLPLIAATLASARAGSARSRSSPIAMPAGSPRSIGAPRWRRSIARTIRHRRPCLGRRDAAAQPGREPHRVGARPARRAAHRHRRQCRRPSDAARPGRSLHRRHRPHDGDGRCRQQDRDLSEGAGRARQRRAVLCRGALAHHRLDASTTGSAKSRSRSATRREVARDRRRDCRRRASRACASRRRAARPRITLST